jgi:hypothetical protein
MNFRRPSRDVQPLNFNPGGLAEPCSRVKRTLRHPGKPFGGGDNYRAEGLAEIPTLSPLRYDYDLTDHRRENSSCRLERIVREVRKLVSGNFLTRQPPLAE